MTVKKAFQANPRGHEMHFKQAGEVSNTCLLDVLEMIKWPVYNHKALWYTKRGQSILFVGFKPTYYISFCDSSSSTALIIIQFIPQSTEVTSVYAVQAQVIKTYTLDSAHLWGVWADKQHFK